MMYKNRILLVTIFLIVLFPLSCLAHADYSGILIDSSLNASSVWSNGSSIEWNIEQNFDNSWNYEYNIAVEDKDISHVIIEVTPNAAKSDFYNFNNGDYSGIEVGLFASNENSNPNMPTDIYGIKFEGYYKDSTNWTISFDTMRTPVWGDFYAKDGRSDGEWITMWNDGFESEDNSQKHIMRPNGKDVAVPEPGSMILIGIGLAGVATWRKAIERGNK